MRPGDTIESAIWLTGEETQDLRDRYEDDVRNAVSYICHEKGYTHGPVRFVEKRPGAERVPAVPDHVQGIDVRLLIGEADVTGNVPQLERRSFIGDLDAKDLERLRTVTRREYERAHPGQSLSNEECDDIIDELGLEAAVEAVRKAVEGQTVH